VAGPGLRNWTQGAKEVSVAGGVRAVPENSEVGISLYALPFTRLRRGQVQFSSAPPTCGSSPVLEALFTTWERLWQVQRAPGSLTVVRSGSKNPRIRVDRPSQVPALKTESGRRVSPPARRFTDQMRSFQLCPAASTIYSTASPLKGAVNDLVEPPLMEPPLVTAPVAGLSHCTFRTRVVADRFTLKVPPFGA
jgi:hypothetical protein